MDTHDKDKIDAALERVKSAPEKSFLNEAAPESVLAYANVMHGKFGYAPLPDDAHYLMGKACGILGPYFTLCGVGALKLEGGGVQGSILEESEAFNAGADEDDKRLVLGRVSGGAVLTFKDGAYALVDGASRDVLRTYDNIADFITSSIDMKTKARAR